MPGQRKFAAILFTDIKDFTRRMHQNEKQAMELLGAHNLLLSAAIERHGGSIVKAIGDSYLAEFSGAASALECALSAQDALAAFNRGRKESDQLLVRMSVHVGNCVRSKDDILGDVVNLASRILAETQPGGIFISNEAYRQVKGKIDCAFVSGGLRRLKGIPELVEVFAAARHGALPLLPAYYAGRRASFTGSLTLLPRSREGWRESFRFAAYYAALAAGTLLLLWLFLRLDRGVAVFTRPLDLLDDFLHLEGHGIVSHLSFLGLVSPSNRRFSGALLALFCQLAFPLAAVLFCAARSEALPGDAARFWLGQNLFLIGGRMVHFGSRSMELCLSSDAGLIMRRCGLVDHYVGTGYTLLFNGHLLMAFALTAFVLHRWRRPPAPVG